VFGLSTLKLKAMFGCDKILQRKIHFFFLSNKPQMTLKNSEKNPLTVFDYFDTVKKNTVTKKNTVKNPRPLDRDIKDNKLSTLLYMEHNIYVTVLFYLKKIQCTYTII